MPAAVPALIPAVTPAATPAADGALGADGAEAPEDEQDL
jgi:hypothetical protein